MANFKRLGKTQHAVMDCLSRHGYWDGWAGWYWDSYSGTLKIMRSLQRRGLVHCQEHRGTRDNGTPIKDPKFWLTDEAEEWLKENPHRV